MLALLCFCVATEFSANKDLYKAVYAIVGVNADEVGERNAARAKIVRMNAGGRAVALFCRCIYHGHRCRGCGDAFPIEGVLVATYLLSVEALPHCRCGVANKNRIV